MVKRLFDIFLVILTALMWLPLLAVTALAVLIFDGRPVFFLQRRAGKGGRAFDVLKFKTMVSVDGGEPVATPLGRWLRKLSLDEIPQLVNVLKGDMSLVGPRPERAYFYDKFETYIHGFKNRLAVTPGLTGLAQVNGGYELEPEEKILYDMQYIREQSLWLDLKLIFKTVKLVFTHEGAR